MADGTDPAKESTGKIWTIPNVLSYLRVVVFLPLSLGLIISEQYVWSLIALFILGSTDWLDGYLARRLNQLSDLGRELDPISDRASILLISLTLVFTGIMPWEFMAIIIAVDAIMAVLAIVLFKGYPTTQVNLIGKARTAVLLLGLPMLLLGEAAHSPGWRTAALIVVSIGVVLNVIAGATYAWQMLQAWRAQRTAVGYGS